MSDETERLLNAVADAAATSAAFIAPGERALQQAKDALLAHIRAKDAAYEEQRAIVAEIWRILGSPSYEQLAGRSIYDLIQAKDERIAELERAFESRDRGTTHSDECWKWHHACAKARVERLEAEVERALEDVYTASANVNNANQERIAELKAEIVRLRESDHPELVLSQINASLRARIAELEAEAERLRAVSILPPF